MDSQLDVTKLKYVLYARKSQDDPQRQVRSIGDQIADCLDFAERNQLNVVGEPIRESESAKTPDKRRKFTQMLKDIKAGKYDAILAWHPDRLLRNMREGGEIIDMIDEGIIKDLKFLTHHFTNDASGKLLLGMAFVLSKHYSDDLSQKVTRGVRRSFMEGKSPAPKHGYKRDEQGLYQPDGKNFETIVNAWGMRLKGDSLASISKYMNDNDYRRRVKRTKRVVSMTPQILSKIFRDPIYYGVLIQAEQTVDLRLLYDFRPAVTEEEYNLVQQLSYRRIKPFKPHRMAFYPLRLMVYCSHCGRTMRVGPSSGHLKRYLYYRCDNDECERKKKSIRAKVIFDFIYNFLENGLNLTKSDYNRYYSDILRLSQSKREIIRQEVHSKEGALKKIASDIKERSLGLIKLEVGSTPFRLNQERIKEQENQAENLQDEINKLKTRLTDPESDRLSLEQFLNLSKNAAVIVKSADVVVKDTICRQIFLNFTVDESKVLSYQLKEPFATLLKQRQLSSSRGERTRTFDLCFPKAAL